MTDLLRQAITQIEKLSPPQQDTLAARIMAELADDDAWEASFSATTDEQWDRLAESVRSEISAGETIPLDDVFPHPQPPS
ncbi:MAG TPA: hypothetical protein VGX70_03765 [Gemmataceae bacterium]|jgi:hypothetical protein|nr:hypothetical protein [Gemmataceae bacterium]